LFRELRVNFMFVRRFQSGGALSVNNGSFSYVRASTFYSNTAQVCE